MRNQAFQAFVIGATLLSAFAMPSTASASFPPHKTTQLVKAKREKHPEIQKAMKALENAKRFLNHADRDFDGHRTKAVQAVDAALAECRAALKADRN